LRAGPLGEPQQPYGGAAGVQTQHTPIGGPLKPGGPALLHGAPAQRSPSAHSGGGGVGLAAEGLGPDMPVLAGPLPPRGGHAAPVGRYGSAAGALRLCTKAHTALQHATASAAC
jgi:hypothetical protein